MPTNLKRYTVPTILLAAVAAFTLAACGGSSSGDAESNLAKYMPADAMVYMEGSVKPEQDVADNANDIATKLTGTSLSDTLDEALASQDASSGITYEDDVKPWLGDNAAMYVAGGVIADPASLSDTSSMMEDASSEDVGLVAESSDVDASQAFIQKASEENKATDGEYEGFDYKVSPDDSSVLGIVDDNVVFATSEDVFKAMVDASKGDSLEGTSAFSAVSGDAADGSMMNMYVANEPILSATQQGSGGVDLNSIYTALGMDLTDTGTLVSLVPKDNEISVVGATNADSTIQSGDASDLIESFPANSVFAIGSGDVGANLTRILDAINKEGIEGILKPGELDKTIQQASQGLDVPSIIESLQDVGFFVSGDSVGTLGGALVATTSDPEPLKNTLGVFSSFIGLAGDAKVKPLGGGLTGFSVRTPELPGRPVVVALQGDRLVVGIGLAASRQALSGKGETLADNEAYKAAEASLDGKNVDMFGDPTAIGRLVQESGEAGGVDAQEFLGKFQYMVSGSGSEDKTFAFNLGLSD